MENKGKVKEKVEEKEIKREDKEEVRQTKKNSKYPEEVERIKDKAIHIYMNEQGVWEVEFEYDIKMVFVESGEFLMGSSDNDDEAIENEKPQHKVWVDSFWIGKYPVRFDEFDVYCMKTSNYQRGLIFKKYYPYDNGWGRKGMPVINVSWYDAVDFTEWLSEKIDLKFRLPTEAEWEYACRGGKLSRGYKYSGSNNVDEVGWYEGNSGSKSHPVGLKKSNELGIYDMCGNVKEWCSDRYGKKYYLESPYRNPKGPLSGSFRVLRGGSWNSSARFLRFLRCTRRYSCDPTGRYNDSGFRLAMNARK